MPNSLKAQQAKREYRRAQVMANLLAGVRYADIAKGLNCSIGTVARDAKIILERLQEEQDWMGVLYIQLECRRLDAAMYAIWPKVQEANLQAIDRMLAIMDRRARYLALNTPYELKLTDAELIAELKKVLNEVATLGPGKAKEKLAVLSAEHGKPVGTGGDAGK